MSKRLNGEGTVYRRKDGLWCAELTLGFTAEGKRIRKCISSKDLKTLKIKLQRERFRLAQSSPADRRFNSLTEPDPAIEKWISHWLLHYKSGVIKPTTLDTYESTFNTHIKHILSGVRITHITPDMVQSIYNRMRCNGSSTSTIRKTHNLLRQALEQARKNGLIYSNPCSMVSIPKSGARKATPLSVSELKNFVENCPGNVYGNLFQFALETGMRMGEIIALAWDDVSFDENSVHVTHTISTIKNRDYGTQDSEHMLPRRKTTTILTEPKSHNGVRVIPLSVKARRVLDAQRSDTEDNIFVFSSKKGTPLNARNVIRAFDSYKTSLGLPQNITMHSLRHTFATRLLERGAGAKAISELLGHSSIQVTLDVYSHVRPGLKQETISLLND